ASSDVGLEYLEGLREGIANDLSNVSRCEAVAGIAELSESGSDRLLDVLLHLLETPGPGRCCPGLVLNALADIQGCASEDDRGREALDDSRALLISEAEKIRVREKRQKFREGVFDGRAACLRVLGSVRRADRLNDGVHHFPRRPACKQGRIERAPRC